MYGFVACEWKVGGLQPIVVLHTMWVIDLVPLNTMKIRIRTYFVCFVFVMWMIVTFSIWEWNWDIFSISIQLIHGKTITVWLLLTPAKFVVNIATEVKLKSIHSKRINNLNIEKYVAFPYRHQKEIDKDNSLYFECSSAKSQFDSIEL